MSEVQQTENPELDIDKLIAQSNLFFDLHWNKDALGAPPEWISWETFLYNSVPNYQYGGCYALFSGEKLVYLGLGVSRGGGIYPQHGISRRLMAHVLRSDPTSGPYRSKLMDNWGDVTAIWTLGFPSNEYLAAALEGYLIRSLSPVRNARV